MSHVHVHAPHELTEAEGGASPADARRLELVATLLLALATLGIAWSGYQAARWSGLQAERYAAASTTRAIGLRVATRAGQDRIQDLLNFNRWLEVSTEGDQQLAALYERRFRDEFRPAFEAWLAEDPIHNPNAIASPLREPQYHPAEFERADRLDHEAEHKFAAARESTEHTDDYVLVTVFLAAVLFLAGISLRFEWTKMRVSVLVIAAIVLLFAFVRLATMPTH
jgi:ferric-dicitrate binding protein FerR (iron transport regulator)